MKNPVTPAGIEPATCRFVAQLLNHCATAVLGNEVVEAVNYVESVHQYLFGGNAENQDSHHQGNQYRGRDLT